MSLILIYTLGILNFFYIPAEIICLNFILNFSKPIKPVNFKIWEFNVAKEVCFINFDVLKGIFRIYKGLGSCLKF